MPTPGKKKKTTAKKPYFANTAAYKKKVAEGRKPGAAKKATRRAKRKQALSKVAEFLNPWDEESRQRRTTRKAKRAQKKISKKITKAMGPGGIQKAQAKTASAAAARRKKIGVSKGTQVRKGAVGVKKTKGGEYVKYGKKTEAAKSFRSTFKAKCAGGAESFTWDGRSYSCAKKGAAKKAGSKAAPAKAKPRSVRATLFPTRAEVTARKASKK